jgi:hypothetical protein
MQTFPMRRFALCLATSTPIVIVISLAGELLNWSDGVSFAALATLGAGLSVTALFGSPLTWLHRTSEKPMEGPG